MGLFHSLAVVGHRSETQLQVGEQFKLFKFSALRVSHVDHPTHVYSRFSLCFLHTRQFEKEMSTKYAILAHVLIQIVQLS